MSVRDNAFAPQFLDHLERLDEHGPALEAEMAGPWKVAATTTGFGLFEQWQDAADEPIGLFRDETTALKFAAALSAASRDPRFWQETERNPDGRFEVLSPEGREGWLTILQTRAVDLAHMADACARSPYALAAILRAAGAATLRKAGEILLRSTEGKLK